jgi:hypothetical protein
MAVSVVQFPHPDPGGGGFDDNAEVGSIRPWPLLKYELPHVRKFLVSSGTAWDGDEEVAGEFEFWAEWEPPSLVVRKLKSSGKRLANLLQRALLPVESPDESHQNTDPLVFGDSFFYSNCRQHNMRKPPNRPNPSKMQALDDGSLILFGSMVGGEFAIDTVFVVGGSEPMTPGETAPASELLRRTVDDPLASGCGQPLDYRLYRGATREDPVGAMFSFVPCRPWSDDGSGFARPTIGLPWFHRSAQSAKVVVERQDGLVDDKGVAYEGSAKATWDYVVEQVLEAGLLLGTRFEAPTAAQLVPPQSAHLCPSNEVEKRMSAEIRRPDPDEPIVTGLPLKVSYEDLSSKQREIFNFQKVAALLADYGFNCIKLADDWQGADFLAYHKDGDQTLKVQLKGRLTIDKKYAGKGLHMAFPVHGVWYIIEHDALVELCGIHTPWLTTKSWANGQYNSTHPNPSLRAALEPFALGAAG